MFSQIAHPECWSVGVGRLKSAVKHSKTFNRNLHLRSDQCGHRNATYTFHFLPYLMSPKPMRRNTYLFRTLNGLRYSMMSSLPKTIQISCFYCDDSDTAIPAVASRRQANKRIELKLTTLSKLSKGDTSFESRKTRTKQFWSLSTRIFSPTLTSKCPLSNRSGPRLKVERFWEGNFSK